MVHAVTLACAVVPGVGHARVAWGLGALVGPTSRRRCLYRNYLAFIALKIGHPASFRDDGRLRWRGRGRWGLDWRVVHRVGLSVVWVWSEGWGGF